MALYFKQGLYIAAAVQHADYLNAVADGSIDNNIVANGKATKVRAKFGTRTSNQGLLGKSGESLTNLTVQSAGVLYSTTLGIVLKALTQV